MTFEVAKCPSCDANIELNPKNTFIVCNYCGANILTKDAIDAYKEEQKKEYRLKIADECLEKGITEDAEDIYKEISKNFPNDYRGWWGIIRCTPIHSYLHGEMKNEYKRALAFAPENIKPEILENQKLRNLYVSKEDKLKRINQIEKEINRLMEGIEKNRESINEDVEEVKRYTRAININQIPLAVGLCLIIASIIVFSAIWWISAIGIFIGICLIKSWNNNNESSLRERKIWHKKRVSSGESYNLCLVNDLDSLIIEKQELQMQINEINKALNL